MFGHRGGAWVRGAGGRAGGPAAAGGAVAQPQLPHQALPRQGEDALPHTLPTPLQGNHQIRMTLTHTLTYHAKIDSHFFFFAYITSDL